MRSTNAAAKSLTIDSDGYPKSLASVARRMHLVIGSATRKSISAIQAGSTSGGYFVHFTLLRARSSVSLSSKHAGDAFRPLGAACRLGEIPVGGSIFMYVAAMFQ